MEIRSHLLLRLWLFFLIRDVNAYTLPCEVVKYMDNKERFVHFDYVCVVTQEGFSNFDQLAGISLVSGHNDKLLGSLANVANSSTACVKIDLHQEFALRAENFFNSNLYLNCTEEFTFIFSDELPEFIFPLKEVREYTVKHNVLAVPQGGMWIHTKVCTGNGNVTISKGVGTGKGQDRIFICSWTCSELPDWIISFDDVITIEVDDTMEFTMECSSHLNAEIHVSPDDKIAVISSGFSDNLQNKENNPRGEVNARIIIGEGLPNSPIYDVSALMKLKFDKSNTGFVALQTSKDEALSKYYAGVHSANSSTNYLKIVYAPKELKPSEIDMNNDNIIIEIEISDSGATTLPTTVSKKPTAAVTSTTMQPHSVQMGPYCDCSTNKFGLPTGWNYNDIWLDIVVILDTSEAMGAESIEDAGELIESFISDGIDDFVITDTNAPFYTRVGVIAMADTAKVLYSLNMTKEDSMQGKVSMQKGVTKINVLDAFDAAISMFMEGLKSQPDRASTRQVIYYMTDSNPKGDLTRLNDFKSQGVIIVNNLLRKGEAERPDLKSLASDGFYYSSIDYALELQTFCKANCFCRDDKNAYGGSDPAIEASGGCVHPVGAGVPFNKAKTTCASEGGILTGIHDEQTAEFLEQLMSTTSSKSGYFWIGFEKSGDGVWQWDDQSTDPYTNWDVNEPSDAAVAKCAYVDTTNAQLPWGAGNCQIGFPYICQYPPCSVGYKCC